MSSTTGEHIDELKARRKRREGRPAAAAGDNKPPNGAKSAGAARDLLRDLIANGPRPDDEGPVRSDAVTASVSEGNVDHLNDRCDPDRTASSSERIAMVKVSMSSCGGSKLALRRSLPTRRPRRGIVARPAPPICQAMPHGAAVHEADLGVTRVDEPRLPPSRRRAARGGSQLSSSSLPVSSS